MKKQIALFLVALILVTGCQPSEQAIQTAIAQTSIALTQAIPQQQTASPLHYTVTYKVYGDGITLAHITYKTTSGLIAEEELPASATIIDLAGNELFGLPFEVGDVYEVDRDPPSVISIQRANPNPTNLASVDFTVTFSESVTNVDIVGPQFDDFILTTSSGISSASVTGMIGSDAIYTVTVNTGTGNGTLRLDVPVSATITDLAGNTLASLPFTDGETYTINKPPAPFTNCVNQTEIPATECDALVAFYNSTNGASWNNTTGWLQTDSPCSWFGVVCGSESNVTGLNLPSNNLIGAIPPELGNLTNLMRLELAVNQLTGSIPTQLGNLTNLTRLSLGDNQLTGSIPTQLGNLTNLTVLSIGNNQLTGSIPAQLGNPTNLIGLFLGDNQLTGSIPSQLGNLTNLTGLYVANNQLSGTIPTELGNLTQLKWLWMDNNQLSGFIPSQFGNLANLVQLELNYNQLTGSIPIELGNLVNLTRLVLNNNQLTGLIPTQLSNLTNLTGLFLANNQLSGSIPTELGNLTQLQYLYLNGNQLSGSIPSQLGNLTNLMWLTTDSNRLSGEFPTSITKLVNLYKFAFDCWITSTDPAVIAFIDALVPGWQNSICPVITLITRVNANPTNRASVQFLVTFSEPVMSVDSTDFSLTTTGVTGASVTGVIGTGAMRIVTVKTGSSNGTIRLDIPSSATITNLVGNPLGGSLPFISGQTYTVNKTLTFNSIAPNDGWVLEKNELLGLGGSLDSASTTFRLGDDNLKKQYRSILSFNTSGLPDNAVITSVALKIKQQSVTNGATFNMFQGLLVDIRKGTFGTSALQATDFQATASTPASGIGPYTAPAVGGWYTFNLSTAKGYINKLATNSGLTQFRLRFKLDDNNNAIANYISFFSGNSATNKPTLIIQYYMP